MGDEQQRRKKKRPPQGKCERCGHEVASLTMSPKQPCPSCRRGVIRSMVSEGDWQECATCGATGYVGPEECGECGGSGHFNVRKNWR